MGQKEIGGLLQKRGQMTRLEHPPDMVVTLFAGGDVPQVVFTDKGVKRLRGDDQGLGNTDLDTGPVAGTVGQGLETVGHEGQAAVFAPQ